MLNLSQKIEDVLTIGKQEWPLHLSFDNVLRLFEMWHDSEIADEVKPYLALKMLLIKADEAEVNEFLKQLDIESAIELYLAIFNEHISPSPQEEAIEYDLAGNPMRKPKTQKGEHEAKERTFSLKYDADYIYSSFFQAYKIDLIEVQGQLHWQKFKALLNGLPDNTKFIEVIKIRTWKEQKGDSQKYKEQMKRLKKEYALPEDVEY
ncbi:Gp15 family bacteriophage protein [Enterococcus cecorum]|uniref:Gp15 family bacteriophage protein n=1 Tax=Enterococcus cecorum TaxID=44008 RepID=UPI000A9B9C74|nr:Gp15 family bacteriophage protein [Enterococcus cecorum]CAI3342981.1 bacteriophage Gp15 family protein [Enterococcus cecorum]